MPANLNDPTLYDLKMADMAHKLGWQVLDQEKFSKEIGPYLGFSRDQLLSMLADADDADEGLPIRTDLQSYFLPADEVKAFFKLNEKPKRKLSLKDENASLRKEAALLKDEIARIRGSKGVAAEAKKDTFVFPEKPVHPVQYTSPVEEDQPLDFTDAKPQSPEEMRQMLKDEMQGKKRK